MDCEESFNKCLNVGGNVEKEVCELLKRKLIPESTIEKIEGYKKEYDLLCNFPQKEVVRFEVKDDEMSSETSNIAIEYECSNKGSGISTTKSDYWVHKVNFQEDKSCYAFLPTPRLRLLLTAYSFHKRRAGDNLTARVHLIPYDLFFQQCDCFLERIPDSSLFVKRFENRFDDLLCEVSSDRIGPDMKVTPFKNRPLIWTP